MNLTLLEADARSMQADLPYTATIASTDYTCTLVELNFKEREFLNNTKNIKSEITLSFIIADLPSATALLINSLITFNGVEMRVLDQKISMDEIEQRVHLGKKYAS